MTDARTSRYGNSPLAADASTTVRVLGELLQLVLIKEGAPMTGYKFSVALELKEMGSGQVLITGDFPKTISGRVRAVIYRAHDNRTAPETKGKEVIHIFDDPPELMRTPEGVWLSGNYQASAVGIQG